MSNYDPKRLVQDFAQRTVTNLDFIGFQERNNQAGVYETTQLINSLFGLIVFPYERIYRRMPPTTPLVDLVDDGWPQLTFTIGKKECITSGELIENMRHGICHANMKFLADERNEIVGILLWNCGVRSEVKTWETQIKIADLSKFVRKFNEILQEIPDVIAQELIAAA